MLCGLFQSTRGAGFKLGIVVDRRPDCLRKRTAVEDANAVVFALRSSRQERNF
jgi:hypothetical protein